MRRSIKAVSPVISILLMIAIAVVASILAYAWVMGYIGFQTDKAGNEVQIQSYTTGGNLVIYVQNTGQGTVHLKQDSSVYVNDVLKDIVNVDNQAVAKGALIPIKVGQTVKVEVNYQNFQVGDRIKVVTVEGTVMSTTGSSNSGSSSGGNSGSTNPASPTAYFIYNPSSPSTSDTITFTDQSIAGSAAITKRSWNFGDGTLVTDAQTTQQTHKYSAANNYAVTLIVTDANGNTGTTVRTITVSATQQTTQAPIAEFTMSMTNPIVNQNVAFTDASIAGSGTINQWSWSFGDGATSTEKNPVHAYQTTGQKTISLTVTDSNGKSSTVSHTLTVDPIPTPTPTPSTNPNVTPTPTPTPTASPSPSPNAVNVAFAVSPAGSGTTTPAAGNAQSYNYGVKVNIQASPAPGYSFSGWTQDSQNVIGAADSASTTATMLSDGTITAHFIPSTQNKLVITSGTNQFIERNVKSGAITVERQTYQGVRITTNEPLTVNLQSSHTSGIFYNANSNIVTQVTIPAGQYQVTFYYADSTTGATTLTTSATGYAPDSTTINVNLLYSAFEGADWLHGFTAGSQPPWYHSDNQGVGGSGCAMSNTAQYLGDGAFSSDILDTTNAQTVTVTFQYRLVDTDSQDQFRLAYSTDANPNLNENYPIQNSFHYYDSISTTQPDGQWHTYTHTFNLNPNTGHFTFRFWTDLHDAYGGRNPTAYIYVDNVVVV
ncbi:MAG: PKD domain-containing protein, partial [Candidatus Bathyarchaeia archaeon]